MRESVKKLLVVMAVASGFLLNGTAHAGSTTGQIALPYYTPPEAVGAALTQSGIPQAFQKATGLPLGQFIGVTGGEFVFRNDCDGVPLSNGVDSFIVRTTGSTNQITVTGTKPGSGYRFAVVGFKGGSCSTGATASRYCGTSTVCTLTGAAGTKFAYVYAIAPSGVPADAAAVTFTVSWS